MNQHELKKALALLPLGDIRYYDSIGSTNNEALAWGMQGAKDLSLVITDEQTAGRGRLDRRWFTPKGTALAFSLILRPAQEEKPYLTRMVGLAALAVAEDHELLSLVQDGSRQAFGVLVERHTERFYRTAYRYVQNREAAEDIVQDAFLKLWEDPGKWQPERKAKFTTWFYRVVVNLCLDWQKKKRPVELDEEAPVDVEAPVHLAMAAATFFVLVGSSVLVSIVRRLVPNEVRITTYILIIATFVTVAEMALQALVPEIYKALGAFVALIVVNCMILSRQEVFAAKHSVSRSALDAYRAAASTHAHGPGDARPDERARDPGLPEDRTGEPC